MVEEIYGKLYLDGKPYRSRALIGSFTSGNRTIECFVWNGEMNKLPHFHLASIDKTLKCCVGIYEPIYVPHKKFKSRLNDQQIKDMVEWLLKHEQSYFDDGLNDFNNWDEIRLFWNRIEGNRIQPEWENYSVQGVPFPDYSKLNDGKQIPKLSTYHLQKGGE